MIIRMAQRSLEYSHLNEIQTLLPARGVSNPREREESNHNSGWFFLVGRREGGNGGERRWIGMEK